MGKLRILLGHNRAVNSAPDYIEHLEAKNHNLRLALNSTRTRLEECEALLKEWSADSPCLTEDEYDPDYKPTGMPNHVEVP